ncbi:Crp/Fnr family transcriptional regulator [Cytophagaceae bacterium DM2B3-1]|uniref:Crp/Fnr family transcriptional regulator n=1 Tax=Xanthocytophaga flava TaxID=3048013 RepID=A0ABT7CQ07_9BACT|nr:Crp/Fnr family transcriptional regulator [Xanthocytophaga flavus]MDJ1495065.1 Crp/Fnr family transcriptional regulator [Xanthocytophaga flavus]
MLSEFKKYLSEYLELPDQEIQPILSSAIPRKLRRNELLLQAGDVCRHKVFIVSGMLRTYSISANGNEHIVQFSSEKEWTLDIESYDLETPATVNIAAVDPAEIILWKKNDFNALLASLPLLKKYSEQLISRKIYENRQRLLTAISATPEEKYDDFIRNNPHLIARIPLHMIASYLGISLKTLTRIRHAQLYR